MHIALAERPLTIERHLWLSVPVQGEAQLLQSHAVILHARMQGPSMQWYKLLMST